MVSSYIILAGVLSIMGSIITAWLCYKISSYNRLSSGWLAVVWAFLLIIVRRIIGFIRDFSLIPSQNNLLVTIESTLLIIISALYIIGFWSMLRNFENYDVVENKIKNIVKRKK